MLQPTVMGKWLVTFCDECNLPAADKYGTQRVITFLRQLVEQNGFWRTSDRAAPHPVRGRLQPAHRRRIIIRHTTSMTQTQTQTRMHGMGSRPSISCSV